MSHTRVQNLSIVKRKDGYTYRGRLMNANRKRHTARVYLHPTATHAPDLIRRVERKTGRKAVLIDGVPVLVLPADANKYLPTGN